MLSRNIALAASTSLAYANVVPKSPRHTTPPPQWFYITYRQGPAKTLAKKENKYTKDFKMSADKLLYKERCDMILKAYVVGYDNFLGPAVVEIFGQTWYLIDAKPKLGTYIEVKLASCQRCTFIRELK